MSLLTVKPGIYSTWSRTVVVLKPNGDAHIYGYMRKKIEPRAAGDTNPGLVISDVAEVFPSQDALLFLKTDKTVMVIKVAVPSFHAHAWQAAVSPPSKQLDRYRDCP